ncbi:MAG: hypothetical protein AAB649_00275 [Patescibacteria group bacterium]
MFGNVVENEDGVTLDEPYYDEALGSMDWDDFIDGQKYQLKKKFPSFSECDKWLGREDHAIMGNNFAYFGISEYMGLVSLWLVAKEGDYYGDEQAGLRAHWVEQVKEKFVKEFSELHKLGTFSNGEAVFERIKK